MPFVDLKSTKLTPLPIGVPSDPIPRTSPTPLKVVAVTIPVALTLTVSRVFHCNEVVPKSLVLVVEGTKSLSNLPVAVIVSEFTLPKSTSPFAFSVLVTVKNEPFTVKLPVIVEALLTKTS